jgi:hypothetical protein
VVRGVGVVVRRRRRKVSGAVVGRAVLRMRMMTIARRWRPMRPMRTPRRWRTGRAAPKEGMSRWWTIPLMRVGVVRIWSCSIVLLVVPSGG